MANKVLKLGTDPFPPYQYYQADGTIAGLDYEFLKNVFAQMGYDIDVTIKDWPEIQPVYDAKGYDAAFQVSKTPEREKKFIFSDIFRYAVTEVVTGKDDLCIAALKDIVDRGLTLGVMAGYTNGDEIDAIPAEYKKGYPTTLALIEGISKREVDAGVVDQGVKEYQAKLLGAENLRVLDKFTFKRAMHVIFHDNALCAEFNRALAQR
ncbi:MAG: transporter substrate-binding domain-containing protein [Defluviitaleaceae bacterium]|nr:transporter substrate-binding domain-containing protein [Defluviitaleaceae bacterium]